MNVVLIAGLPSLIVPIALLALFFRSWKHQVAQTSATPVSAIANTHGGVAHIAGRALPSEQGLVQSPFSGEYVVWWRLTVRKYYSSRSGGGWMQVAQSSGEKTAISRMARASAVAPC
jgi:hypothetical protein